MGAGALPKHAELREDASGERLALAMGGRARTLHGFVDATRHVLGEAAYARVSREVAPHVLDGLALDGEDWVPLEHIVAWCEAAIVDVPQSKLRPFVDHMMDQGFGRVHRVLLAIATPHGVLRRAGEMWREEFTDGRLVAYATSPNTAIATLYDHRFLESPGLRAVVAESFRYTLALSGARDVIEEHGSEDGGPLLVRFSWR